MIPSLQQNVFVYIMLLFLPLAFIQQNQQPDNSQQLSNCTEFCIKCLDTQSCLLCDQQNFYFLNDAQQCTFIDKCTEVNDQKECIKCLNPYFSQSGQCVIGQDIQNCLIKSSDQNCLLCQEFYYPENGQCFQVQQNINNCKFYSSINTCQQCNDNYVLTKQNSCIPKIQNCQLHQNITCKKCMEGYYLSDQIEFDYLQILLNGNNQILYYKKCLPLIQVENCVKYNSKGLCEICDLKHYLENNKCIFQPPLKYNVDIIENCFRYYKKSQCYQCNFNYQLSVDKSQCLPIQSQQGCLSYSSLDLIGQCNQCALNYILDENKHCQQRQYYPIENCLEYSENFDKCEKCNINYIQAQNDTECKLENCKLFQSSQCQQCEDLYYLDQDICVKGTKDNCIKYYQNENKCFQCDYQNGYILENENCVQSDQISNCKIYDSNLNCIECNQNALPIYIKNSCQLQQRRLQALIECEEPLIINFDQTECVEKKFSNCTNYDDQQCYECLNDYILYKGICVEIFAHYTQNCEQQNSTTFYLDFLVDYLIEGDQSQYLQVHDESQYSINNDLIALKYDDFLYSNKPQWTETNKTLQNFDIKRKNFTNLKFVKNQPYCKQCSTNTFPSFALGFCAAQNYVSKQNYHTEGCQSYYEENCIQCKQNYYLSFEYILIDNFKIELQQDNNTTEDNITINGDKERVNKYGYMYKTYCTQTCQNIAEKGLINTPIYSKYLQFLNSGSFFRFNSNAKFTTSRAEIVLVNNICLDEFDKQQDLDQQKISNKYEGCTHISSSVLANNHISKPYRSSLTSSEQFSIFQHGKNLQKNSHVYCSKCQNDYVKLYDLNYNEYKKSVVIDLDSTPTNDNNPFVKYTLGHHCVQKQDQRIFELIENCDIYTIESFPVIQSSMFHYSQKETDFNSNFQKIFSIESNNEINQSFLFHYKSINELNRNFEQNSKFEKKIVCVKCKFGFRDKIEPQKNFSVYFPEQCSQTQKLNSLNNSLQQYFNDNYGMVPYWLFEGFQTKEELQQSLMFLYFITVQNGFTEGCFQYEIEQEYLQCQEFYYLNDVYTIENIINGNTNQQNAKECTSCQAPYKLHIKNQNLNIILKDINGTEFQQFDLQVETQNCYAPKRYFENCQEQIPFCDLSRQLEPSINPKSYFFSCHFCLPQNGVEYAPIMNIKGMNLILNVSKFQEEIFANHNYKFDPEKTKRKGYEVLNQPYLYLSPLNDEAFPDQQNPDHFIACWPIQKLQINEQKTIQQSQQDQTIYIHQGENIAEMNYRLFTFEKVQIKDDPLKKNAFNNVKEDQGQLYKGVYCKDSSFYFTFDSESLNQVEYTQLASGDVDINKMVFNYLVQGLIENTSISCTNNLTPSNIKKQCSNYKPNADGICQDQDLSFGLQITQHYDQIRNKLRNFPLLFTDQELQRNFDKQNSQSKFETYSLITKELFQDSSRNFAASMYLLGLDSGNLDIAFEQLPFFQTTGQNDYFNYGFFHINNGIENCAIEGFARKSLDEFQLIQDFSIDLQQQQINGQFDPFQSNDEKCLNKFSFEQNGLQKCYYYAQSQNYQNFYDYYDLNKNQQNSIGCLKCKDGYELVDNQKSCQKIQIPHCQQTNGLLKNSDSLSLYVIDNMYINSFFGLQQGIGCSQCDSNYVSLNDNEIQFYQENISELNSINNKIKFSEQQFTHKNQMCIQLQSSINKIENCNKYGLDMTKQQKNQIYTCQECVPNHQPSLNKNYCLIYPQNCKTADLINQNVQCIECQDNFIYNSNNNTCNQKIIDCDQHIFNDQNQLICQLCNNGQQNTLTCETISNCIELDQNYQCANCQEGYQNFLTSCVQLPENCQQVDQNGQCQNCISNQYYLIENVCQLLPENCIELDSNLNCSLCQNQYVLKNLLDGNTLCILIELPQNLQNCQNYQQVQNSNDFECNQCIDLSYQLLNLQTDILICHLEIIQNCQQYKSISTFNQQFECVQCVDQKILQDNQCIVDRNLVENCKEYEPLLDQCKECIESYQLLETNNAQKQCVQIINVENCANYSVNNDKCEQCEQGYTLNNNQDFCQDDRCIQYQENICLNCNEFSYLQNGKCFNKIQNCEIQNIEQCQKCNSEYYLENNNCLQLSIVENCEQYSLTQNKCELCNQNYFLQDDQLQCIQVQEEQSYDWLQNCLLYGTKSECKICQQGYYLNDQNQCSFSQTQIQNCLNYSSDSQCQECEENYQLYNQNCYQADQNNCLVYQSSYYDNYQCSQCQENFILSLDRKCLQKSNYLNDNNEFQYSLYLEQNINIFDYVSNLTVYEQQILQNQNCKVFNENHFCIQCQSGYYLNINNNCIQINQQNNCEILEEINLECLSCKDGYLLQNNKCNYNSESSGCYFYFNNECKMCETNNYKYECSLENNI